MQIEIDGIAETVLPTPIILGNWRTWHVMRNNKCVSKIALPTYLHLAKPGDCVSTGGHFVRVIR